jgi:hypothetical protein
MSVRKNLKLNQNWRNTINWNMEQRSRKIDYTHPLALENVYLVNYPYAFFPLRASLCADVKYDPVNFILYIIYFHYESRANKQFIDLAGWLAGSPDT